MSSHSTTHLRRATVLVVDDEDINRTLLANQLENEGHSVLEAEDGDAALNILESTDTPIDLILLDVVMPIMDGYQLCSRIKADPKHFTLPIVFVTSLQDQESRVRGLEAGCDDFLNKPVDPIELNIRVKNLLRVKAFHDMRNRQRELLEFELDRIRDQLLRTDRLATVGTLAAGTGHELNNILSVLQMSADIIKRRAQQTPPLPPRDTDLARIDTVINHIGIHARTLLNYGRPGPEQAEKCDICDIVRQTMDMLRVSGRVKHATFETKLAKLPVFAEVNRNRMEQVLVNLIFNAVDAVAENIGKPKQVKIGVEELNGRVFCRVSDNGCGIKADKLNEIFNPYYTTKPIGQGTGLGLPVVKNIVESYKGTIRVESQEGVGTTAIVELPGA